MHALLVILAQAAPVVPPAAPSGGWFDWVTANWALILLVVGGVLGFLKAKGWIKAATAGETVILALNKAKKEHPEAWKSIGAVIKREATAADKQEIVKAVVAEVVKKATATPPAAPPAP